jgi:TonB family protein
LTLVVLVTFSAVCLAQESSKWQRYIATNEEFSALLPEEPSVSAISRPISPLEKPKHGRMYAAYDDGTGYVILSLDNPDRKEALEVFINEFPQYRVFHAGFEFEHEVTLNGLKGKQYRLSTGSISGIVQFYLTNKNAYIFVVVSEDLSKPSVKKFLTSLTLDGKTKGKDISGLSQSEEIKTPTAPLASASSDTAASQNSGENKIYNPKEVTRKAVIVTSPEPHYTEEARQNQIAGTVVLRGVFSSTGKLTNIRTMSGLQDGLTQRAIEAAKQIKFLPATKDGKYVSQYIQIEYNFSLY